MARLNQMFILAQTPAQFATIARLARDIWTAHYTPIIGAAQVDYMLDKFQSAAAIAAQVQREGYLYYLAEIEGEAIGYFAVQPRDSTLFLSKIYVHAAWRGQGWGRRMLDDVAQLAQQAGKPSITLTVNRQNTGAIAAYGKLGFANTGPLQTDIGSGFIMDDFCLVKALPQQ
ncbi:MAG: GNAT family N-acetyltransferase [Cyanobacteria bacterium P01_G01_bin.54]